MRLPRWFHRWYAHHFGYFWLVCRYCGHYFGGHESGWLRTTEPGLYRTPCKRCARDPNLKPLAVEVEREPGSVTVPAGVTLHSPVMVSRSQPPDQA
jgi:hypothetical protein